jgi:HlyD family secretion protein
MKKFFIILLLVGLVAGAGGLWYERASGRSNTVLKTAPVELGPMAATISATGTIEPEEVVDVGAQVAGMIIRFGPDPHDSTKTVDFGTSVEEKSELAFIDDALYVAAVDSAKADLGMAEANLASAKANLASLKSKLWQTQRDLERAQRLGRSQSIASVDFDTAQNAYDAAKAAVPVGEAAVLQAQKSVEKAKASLATAQTNLRYTIIRAPVKGTVIDRRVNIGQTVISSLSAPSLFLLAKDLRRLQVWASVNEADIGQIHSGLPVNFTVDAFPGQVFKGTVNQVRLNATMNQNVVTYTVVVDTKNDDLKLKPYLTANLTFMVSQRDKVLQVPNAALRWKPQPQQVVPEARKEFMASLKRQQAQAQGGPTPAAATSAPKDRHDHGMVWVKEGNLVRPVKVRIGLSDGMNTEVIGDNVKEGMEVVIRETQPEPTDDGGSNPFAPKLFSGKK